MSGNKKSIIPWPFAPKEVDLNRDTDLLKLIAMVSMLIDHLGAALLPQHYFLRIIGRLAFPIYAYCTAVGCVYSRNRAKYLSRILLMGLISQPFYMMALHSNAAAPMYAYRFVEHPLQAAVNFYIQSWSSNPNIMITLALGLLIGWSLREKRLVCVAAASLLAWKLNSYAAPSYGWHGVLLIVLFYLFIQKWWLSLPVMFLYMFWWGLSFRNPGMLFSSMRFDVPLLNLESYRFALFGVPFSVQMFALFALPLIYIRTYSRFKINRWIFYLFYPAHLIGIILVPVIQRWLFLP